MPCVTSDEILVDIILHKKRHTQFLDMLKQPPQYDFIPGFFTVTRNNSYWSVSDIQFGLISDLHNQLKKEINCEKYIERTKQGYRFNRVDIDVSSLTDIEKRLLRLTCLMSQTYLIRLNEISSTT